MQWCYIFSFSTPGATRTLSLLLRSQVSRALGATAIYGTAEGGYLLAVVVSKTVKLTNQLVFFGILN